MTDDQFNEMMAALNGNRKRLDWIYTLVLLIFMMTFFYPYILMPGLKYLGLSPA
ncbi:hypothetical protein [Neorhizobium sp. T7_12]|uniref:hypothetical protein n=1 Tax=Neorhizobium sp. T7_12 TaxID=2093832 RepID=UPI00155F3BBA|nr:hypothetical protein [Neorhizobium sp. T7_12]